MTNNEVLSLYEGLQSVKNSGDIKFPARTTFIVVRNMKTLEPIVDAIVEAKNGLLKELGTPDEKNPGSFFIPEENRQKLAQQMEDLDNIDNNIEFKKIKWEDIEPLNLSIQAMEALYPMIEEEN